MTSRFLLLLAGMAAASLANVAFCQYVYVTDYSGTVDAFSIDPSTGALSPVPGSPFYAGTNPASAVAVDPTGNFAYVASANIVGLIYGYSIDAGTGALIAMAGSPFAAGSNPNSIAIDPRGGFLSVSTSLGPVLSFSADPGTGALTPIAGSQPPQYGTAVAIDTTGRFLYLADDNSSVYAWAIGTSGTLTAITGSPFRAGKNPYAIAVDPRGKFMYTADQTIDGIFGLAIQPKTGALRKIAGTPFPAGRFLEGMAIDPTGQFLYAANSGYVAGYGVGVSAYTINAATGALTAIAGSPFAASTNIAGVAVDPTGKYAYVIGSVSSAGGIVSAFAIDQNSGALIPVPGSPFPSGGTTPRAITTAPLKVTRQRGPLVRNAPQRRPNADYKSRRLSALCLEFLPASSQLLWNP